MSHGLARQLYTFPLNFPVVRLINEMSSRLSAFGYLKSQQVHFMFLPPTFPLDFF